jgi:hypothetical protein
LKEWVRWPALSAELELAPLIGVDRATNMRLEEKTGRKYGINE